MTPCGLLVVVVCGWLGMQVGGALAPAVLALWDSRRDADRAPLVVGLGLFALLWVFGR